MSEVCQNKIKTKWGDASIYNGYYQITTGKYVRKFLHRLIYEDYHKVTICDWVHCHHKDHNSLNNHPSNLELLSRADHASLHHKGKEGMKGEDNPMYGRRGELSPLFKGTYRVNRTGMRNGKYLWKLVNPQMETLKYSFDKDSLELLAKGLNEDKITLIDTSPKFARVRKNGFTHNNKQMWELRDKNGKRIKTSIYKDKLQKIADEMNKNHEEVEK